MIQIYLTIFLGDFPEENSTFSIVWGPGGCLIINGTTFSNGQSERSKELGFSHYEGETFGDFCCLGVLGFIFPRLKKNAKQRVFLLENSGPQTDKRLVPLIFHSFTTGLKKIPGAENSANQLIFLRRRSPNS